MPYLIFLSVCLVWSVSFILMKKATLAFTPAEIGWWRVVAGAATLGLLWAWRDRAWNVRWRDAGPLLAVVLAGCTWPYAIQPWVIARQGSAFMALMVSFVPLLTVVLSVPVLRVRPSARQLVGVLGSLGCLALLLGDGFQRAVPVWDLMAAFTVPLGYSVANLVIRRRLGHVGALQVTLVSLAGSLALLAPIVAVGSGRTDVSAESLRVAWLSLAVLGIVGTGLATFLFNQLIRDHGPLFAGMTTNLVPLGAVLFGWLDGEPISWRQFTALLGIVLMVTLVQYRAACPQPSGRQQ